MSRREVVEDALNELMKRSTRKQDVRALRTAL
jgi:hypothetical protein